MPKRYIVRLSEEEQEYLKAIVSTGKSAAYKIKHANILLNYDSTRRVICMDEQSVQLVKETRMPLPAKPGQPSAIDYEYERNGTANLFMFTEPLTGWRKVVVSQRRTAIDWAQEIGRLLEQD